MFNKNCRYKNLCNRTTQIVMILLYPSHRHVVTGNARTFSLKRRPCGSIDPPPGQRKKEIEMAANRRGKIMNDNDGWLNLVALEFIYNVGNW